MLIVRSRGRAPLLRPIFSEVMNYLKLLGTITNAWLRIFALASVSFTCPLMRYLAPLVSTVDFTKNRPINQVRLTRPAKRRQITSHTHGTKRTDYRWSCRTVQTTMGLTSF